MVSSLVQAWTSMAWPCMAGPKRAQQSLDRSDRSMITGSFSVKRLTRCLLHLLLLQCNSSKHQHILSGLPVCKKLVSFNLSVYRETSCPLASLRELVYPSTWRDFVLSSKSPFTPFSAGADECGGFRDQGARFDSPLEAFRTGSDLKKFRRSAPAAR